MRGCDITASAYNAAAPNAAYAATANATMQHRAYNATLLIRRLHSSAYIATMLIRSRCSSAYNATMLISSGMFIMLALLMLLLLMRCEICYCCYYCLFGADAAVLIMLLLLMLISSGVLIIQCRNAYNAANASARMRYNY